MTPCIASNFGYGASLKQCLRQLNDQGIQLVERGLPHPNTSTVQLPTVFIGLRPTGLPGTIKEFVMNLVSAQLNEGVHDVAKFEIARAISQGGGSVSRTGLKLALTELSEGTTRFPPRLLRVSPGRYVLRTDEAYHAETPDK